MKHVASDLNLSGISDNKVYQVGVKLRRLIVTFNRKDFEPMALKSKETGIIAVSTNLSDEQIDKKITAILAKNTKGNLYGKFYFISK